MNNAFRQKVWLSWSSGKDSYAALSALQADGQYEIESSFTVVDTATERIPMHAVNTELLAQQVRAIGLRHRLVPLHDKDQAGGIQDLIDDAQSDGVRFFAFGDLFLDDIRSFP